jgi:selenocysteine-specific elongation factor
MKPSSPTSRRSSRDRQGSAVIGTAHIDHGKTSLVRALTGVDTDRLKEEKARGISIDLGFAYLPAPDGSVLGFVDVPGHEKFVHNMLAGATGIDFVLLVIAADDGVMPQTREHLAIVDLLGIDRGLVALTKADLVAPPQLAKVSAEIAQFLQGTSLEGAEIVPVSTVTGDGIDALRDRLFDAARTIRARAASERFRLAVDRSFTLPGAGTVVTGTVLSGAVSTGDRVTVSPSGLAARVRSIHAQNRPTERGLAGQRCALNLTGDGISKEAIERGHVMLDPDLHAPSDRIDATFRLLATEPKPVTQWMPVRLHHAATEVGARIVLLGDAPIPPGGEAPVQLVLEKPIAATAGDRFVLRDTTAQRTIGGGKFLDLRRRRAGNARLAQLTSPRWRIRTRAGADRLPPSGRSQTLRATWRSPGADRLGASGSRRRAEFSLSRRDVAAAASLAATLSSTPKSELPGMALEPLRQLEPRLPAPAFRSS